ncbi:MAG TPA: hypothetical protein VGZ22_10130 [Isosphaeraceae bacterium]|nr:hypothetical protein [Isosphaeraceae bacterium]
MAEASPAASVQAVATALAPRRERDLSHIKRLGDPLLTLRRWLVPLMLLGIVFSATTKSFEMWVIRLAAIKRLKLELLADEPAFAQSDAMREAIQRQSAAGSSITLADMLDDWREFALGFVSWGVLYSLASLAPLYMLLRILPRKKTDAFYLRSFRRDETTLSVRQALRAGLTRRFRLSGIRDPRRRMPSWLRVLDTTALVYRYATPKYMNLEAGADWKARLWRSLADARCAFIDLTEVTPFLDEEIDLTYRCLGLERILFLGGEGKSVEEWRASVSQTHKLLESEPSKIRVAIWTRPRRKAFVEEVRAFAAALPPGPAGLKVEAFPGLSSVSTEAITEESMSDALGGQLFLWLITTAGIAILFSSLGTDMPGLASSIGNLPTYALWSYGLLSFLRFVLEGGIELR